MGSVKDLIVYREPTEKELGKGDFVFSDRFSVFDWGEMPDHIPYKGKALCLMAAWNFEQMTRRSFPSHYLGVREDNGKLARVDDLTKPSNTMSVSLSRVVKPRFVDGVFDYSYFADGRGKINNFVVPLEVIYRSGAPKGSSLLKTLDDLEAKEQTEEVKKLLAKYGLTEKPKPGDLFSQTGYDFTTKYEPTDRKVSDDEAHRISGLTEEQFIQMTELRREAVNLVLERAANVGLFVFDGKHEYRCFDGKVSIVDVFGTLDENRFMLGNQQVSKEFLRQVFKAEQKDWVNDVGRAKKEAKERGIESWKSLVKIQPVSLDKRLINLVGEMYASASEKYTGLRLFGARKLEEVMKDLEPYYPK